MAQITLFAVFNILGLAMTAWGATMLMGTHSPFGPVAAITLTSGGLGLVLLSTVLLIASVLAAVNWKTRAAQSDESKYEIAPAVHIPHRDYLITAMESVQRTALELIERRREIHHLNMHQWHYAHREETAQEIAAAKRYRQAKVALELHRLSLPTQFWTPVDSFCDTIESHMTKEVYSPPNDKQIYETFNRLWHSAMRQINDLTFSTSPMEGAPQAAD